MKSKRAVDYIVDTIGGLAAVHADKAVQLAEQDAETRTAPMLKFCKKMAKHEFGVAPLPSYFQELIAMAREALKHYENE